MLAPATAQRPRGHARAQVLAKCLVTGYFATSLEEGMPKAEELEAVSVKCLAVLEKESKSEEGR